MKTKLVFLTAVMACTFAGHAMALTKEEYKAQGDRISADYKAGRDKCGALKDNAKDICMAEAKGAEKTAKAELEVQYKPSPRNDEKLAVAKADAAYDVAKEKCDDLKGNDKDVCVKDAKATQVKAKENAKVAAASADKNSSNKAANVSETKKDAAAEKREADYKAAKERCDALSGNAKDTCQNDAKAKYGTK